MSSISKDMKIEMMSRMLRSRFFEEADVWMHTLNILGPDGAHGKILEFAGSAIDVMPVEDRMILCGNAGFAGADGAILQSDAITQKWFKDNFDREVATILSDSDATFDQVIEIKAEEIAPMVTVPPEVFTSKPVSEIRDIKVNQCIIGTCVGGTLQDLRVAAEIVKGKKVAQGVRFLISPVTERVIAHYKRC